MSSIQERWTDVWRDPQRGAALVLRAGFLGAAVISWHAATVIHESGSTVSYAFSTALMLVGYLLGFVNLVLAVHDRPPARLQALIPLALVLTVAVWGQMAHVAGREQGVLSTDVWVFMDYAARLLLAGENPYRHDLLDAFRVNRMGFHFSTPLLDGSLSGRVAYPALSFLVFVPFAALSLSTEWIFPLSMVACWILIYRWAPPQIRPLVLLPFFFEDRFLFYAFGGVSDSGWALLLLLMIRSWQRPILRAVWYGLAASFKHQPWLLAPLLLVRIWNEAPEQQRLAAAWRFASVSAGTFFVLNLPFVIWDARAWLAGVFEPVVAPMITFGQGLSALSMFGAAAIPKGVHAALMLSVYGFGLWAYGRHHHRLRALLWLVPAVALFFSNRSLTSYWYYYLIPLLLDLVSNPASSPPTGSSAVRPNERRWRQTVLVGAGLAAVIGGVTLWGVVRARPLDVEVLAPIVSSGNFPTSIDVEVNNRSDTRLEPRFAVQSGALQPYLWQIKEGPRFVKPGKHARFRIASTTPFSSFDMRRGARVTVRDARRQALRATARVFGEPQFAFPDVIPNPNFLYWDAQGRPTFWGFARKDAGCELGLRRQPASEGAPGYALAFSLPGRADDEAVILDTYVVLPAHPLELAIHVPEDANRLPELSALYGVRLVVEEKVAWVLFGDRATSGTLDGEAQYLMLPAPRAQWSRVRVDLEAVLRKLGFALRARRIKMPRFDHIDIPVVPLNFQLAWRRREAGAAGERTALFGPVRTLGLRPAKEALFARARRRPQDLQLWLAGFNFEARNYELATDHFMTATQLAPRSYAAWLGLGDAQLWLARWGDAERSYERAVALARAEPLAYKGLGWALLNQQRGTEALLAWRRALELLRARGRPSDGPHRGDVHRGMALALIGEGRCDAAIEHIKEERRLLPDQAPPKDFALCPVRPPEKEGSSIPSEP